MRQCRKAAAACVVLFVLFGWLPNGINLWGQECQPSFVATPLADLAKGKYLGFERGLYENGSNAVPADHDADGKAIASQVQLLDTRGNPSPNGKIVILSLGPSVAQQEWSAFIAQAATTPGVNNKSLVILNGAQPQYTACRWTQAYGLETCTGAPALPNVYDLVRNQVLAPAHVTELQVQAAWLDNANASPGITGWQSLCDASQPGCVNSVDTTEALRYEQNLGATLRTAKLRYPNLKEFFLSSRIYAGYSIVSTSPEPFAYEYGFSNQFLIEAQINQIRTGAVDPVAGDLDYNNGTAPWVAWAAYLWADGCAPRSDGLTWQPDDYILDGMHPDTEGRQDVAELLMNLFLVSPYTPWLR